MTKTALTAILFISVLLACRKNDLTTPLNDPKQAITKFFTLPNITNPAVARIAQKLQSLHDRTGFVHELIEKDGYALWEKALINLPARSGRSANTANNTDTIIYIPLVLDNTDYVDAFICARLSDTIQLQLHRGREYASYGFGNLTDTANNAEKLAVQLMLLNESSFGHKDFKLLDNRLLKNGSLPPTARTRNRMVHVEPANTAQRSGFQTVQYEVCTSTQYLQCTSNHACCPDGSCSGCQAACWHTNTQCQTVSVLVYIDNGNWGLGDGGNTGGGGSGGGIINTNGPQPCNPTPLLGNGLLPCELGNNIGWGLFEPIAINEVDYSEISDSCLRSLIQQFNLPKHKSYIFNTYNQYQATNTAQHLYKVKYLQDTTLVGDNGLPIPGRSNIVKLADGTNYVTVRLNPLLFSNSSKEWAATIILHELSHGIISVIRPQDSTGLLQHKAMFDRGIPISIYQGLKELFPSIVDSDGLALGMDGLSQAYMVDDPNNPNGPQIISPVKDNLAQTIYYQSISMAILIARAYRNRTLGTPYCQ